MTKKRILLTNDDGARAKGLRFAYDALVNVGDVIVIAPRDHRSGASHQITLEAPLRARPLGDLPGYMVDFTPVDCVKLALKELLDTPPDLVVSGINRGNNGGPLVHYSGTVAAAKEATLEGFQAIAVSLAQHRNPDFSAAGRVAALVAQKVLETPLPKGVILNVNVPPGPWESLKGFRWCRQSLSGLQDTYQRREDPRGRPYFWLEGAGIDAQGDDLLALEEGFVAITPLSIDWTDEETYGKGGGAWVDGLDDALRT